MIEVSAKTVRNTSYFRSCGGGSFKDNLAIHVAADFGPAISAVQTLGSSTRFSGQRRRRVLLSISTLHAPRRETRSYPAQFVSPAGIIDCVGGRDAAAEERLKVAMARSRMTNIRSLRRAPDEPDDTSWLDRKEGGRRRPGFWLSDFHRLPCGFGRDEAA